MTAAVPASVVLYVRVPKPLKAALDAHAADRGIPLARAVAQLLDDALDGADGLLRTLARQHDQVIAHCPACHHPLTAGHVMIGATVTERA